MLLQPRTPPRLLSLVIPCYNEEAVFPLLQEKLSRYLPQLGVPCEIVFVDDGSSDQTPLLIMQWASENPSVKALFLARNFGHQNAITAGLREARGDAIVLLDADLQDPIEVVPSMVEKYVEGYDVVYGQRLSRTGETWFKRLSAWVFYRLTRWFVHPNLPADVGEFRLISRRCVDALLSMNEVHRFLRGMVAWVGFMQVNVPYHRSARAAGSTKYTTWKMMRFAVHAVVSFTTLPLRLSLIMGLFLAFCGILYGLYALYGAFHYHDTVPGWSSQIAFTSILGGAILISNGIVGEYVGRCFEQLKDRPLYIIARKVNLD